MISGIKIKEILKRWAPPPILEAAREFKRSRAQGSVPQLRPRYSADEARVQKFINRARKSKAISANELWWQDIYKKPCFDLGGTGLDYLKNIYSPLYNIDFVDKHLHDQFKEGADHHASKYILDDYYQAKLLEAFAHIGLEVEKEKSLTVIDVGSGSGNTVIPMLNILPKTKLVATELSLQMLAALKRRLVEAGHAGKATLLQLKAEELDFKDESVDLVIGGAILHHMFRPDKTLRGAARILKPGGYAIFFEPFSAGNMMLEIMFQSILDRGLTHPIPRQLSDFLRGFIDGVNSVWGTDKSDPKFEHIDDKWLFPKSFFLDMVGQAGFKDCTVIALQDKKRQFECQAETVLLNYGSIPREIIPEWVWEIFRDYDRSLSDQRKSELLIEGCVILKK